MIKIKQSGAIKFFTTKDTKDNTKDTNSILLINNTLCALRCPLCPLW